MVMIKRWQVTMKNIQFINKSKQVVACWKYKIYWNLKQTLKRKYCSEYQRKKMLKKINGLAISKNSYLTASNLMKKRVIFLSKMWSIMKMMNQKSFAIFLLNKLREFMAIMEKPMEIYLLSLNELMIMCYLLLINCSVNHYAIISVQTPELIWLKLGFSYCVSLIILNSLKYFTGQY